MFNLSIHSDTLTSCIRVRHSPTRKGKPAKFDKRNNESWRLPEVNKLLRNIIQGKYGILVRDSCGGGGGGEGVLGLEMSSPPGINLSDHKRTSITLDFQ